MQNFTQQPSQASTSREANQSFPMSSAVGMSTADPNSIPVFKHNIQIVLEQVLNLQVLARNTLLGIQNAYHPGSSPTQTEANINALKQNLELLADLSVHTGVGALPILGPVSTNTNTTNSLSEQSSSTERIPSETQMIADASRSIQILFERLKRVQDSAATVSNLLLLPTTNTT